MIRVCLGLSRVCIPAQALTKTHRTSRKTDVPALVAVSKKTKNHSHNGPLSWKICPPYFRSHFGSVHRICAAPILKNLSTGRETSTIRMAQEMQDTVDGRLAEKAASVAAVAAAAVAAATPKPPLPPPNTAPPLFRSGGIIGQHRARSCGFWGTRCNRHGYCQTGNGLAGEVPSAD